MTSVLAQALDFSGPEDLPKPMASMRQILKRYTAVLRRRKGARIYGVGAAKTGTHSLADMFSDRVHSRHEVDAEKLINLHLARVDMADPKALHEFLRFRDKTRNLKIDVSQVNIFLIQDFEHLFPGSLYVQTIRPPMAWLRSMVDDSLRRDTSDSWMRFRDYRFQKGLDFPTAETALEERGLFTLEGYLGYWRHSITSVCDHIEPDRLLTVQTETLAARSAEIAQFMGIPAINAQAGQSHSFANTQRFGVLAQIPRAHLEEVTHRLCGDLMPRFFPERDLAADIAEVQKLDTS